MKIAVLSGKGGTGKTTVSASLAYALENSQYIDCDVEEPNGAIFLKPVSLKTCEVNVPVPEVDATCCTGCGACAKVCQFHALAVIKGNVLVFAEICHHCGACRIACPAGAIHETSRTIGVVETSADGAFIHGRLNIGEPVGIPIIRELKKRMSDKRFIILDCPPGASCAVMKSVEGCDFGILVTEPTPFGLHDLQIAAGLMEKVGIPYGVIINKATPEEKIIQPFCTENGIEVLLEMPFSQEIAANYSNGILPVQADPDWKARFRDVARKCVMQVEEEAKR